MTPQERLSEVSGFILAGGASRRMGTDKAHLPFGSETILNRQVRLLRGVCRTVAIIASPARFVETGIQTFEDEIPGKGPLGGIHTGLRRARTEFSLFLGCDMPLMVGRFLRYLCEQALASPALVTLPPPWAGGRFPLCVVLRRAALARVRFCLESGQNKLGRFFLRAPHRTISKPEFTRAGFSTRIFCNLNTPEEYERMQQQWAR